MESQSTNQSDDNLLIPGCESLDRQTSNEEFEEEEDFVVLNIEKELAEVRENENQESRSLRQYFLRVTELPAQVTEQELCDFFQDRMHCGGGPVQNVTLDRQQNTAEVHFADSKVIQRVLDKAPFLMKNKKIHVELVSRMFQEQAFTLDSNPHNQQDIPLALQQSEKRAASSFFSQTSSVDQTETPLMSDSSHVISTIEVRNIESEDEAYMCLYYFENPDNGGGSVDKHIWDKQNVLYITFKEDEVADRILSMPHVVEGKKVDVRRHQPVDAPNIERSTVEVRNFDPNLIDLYRLYFETQVSRKGAMVDLQTNESKTVLYITFDTPEVAKCVASSNHVAGGRELKVTLPLGHEPAKENSHTVVVRGCDLEGEKVYRMYFQNPAYGGGKILESKVEKDLQAILFTFESPEVAKAVCQRPHIVKGHTLDVTLQPLPPLTLKTSDCGMRERVTAEAQMMTACSGMTSEDIKTPLSISSTSGVTSGDSKNLPSYRTIELSAGHRVQREDIYLYYFENTRMGGGDVEKIQVVKETGVVLVTFVNSEVAARMAGRCHTINGQKIYAKLYIPPKPRPVYPNKLLVQNIGDSTKDTLRTYVDFLTHQEPKEIWYADDKDDVLVIFNERLDFKKVKEFYRKRPLNKTAVSPVPVSKCILVEGLRATTTEDMLTLYFENKRSLGGTVEEVHKMDEIGWLVYFADYKVIERVLSKNHVIEGCEVRIKHYFECLGPSGGTTDPNSFTPPKPFVSKSIDPYVQNFICRSSTARSTLFQELACVNAQPVFDDNSLRVECTLTTSTPNARKLARSWTQAVEQVVNKFANCVKVFKQDVLPETWHEVTQAILQSTDYSSDCTLLIQVPENNVVVVVGQQGNANDVFERVKTIVNNIEGELNRKKAEITKVTGNMPLCELKLLEAKSFISDTERQHQHLIVEIQFDKRQVVFHGLMQDVQEAQIKMLGVLRGVSSERNANLSPEQASLLENQQTKDFVAQRFKNENVIAVWEKDGDLVSMHAFGDRDLVKAIHILRESVGVQVYPFKSESAELLSSEKYKTFVDRLLAKHKGKVTIKAVRHDITITGTCDILESVRKQIQDFIEENTVYSNKICFPPSKLRFLRLFWRDKLDSLTASLQAHRVQLNIKDYGKVIIVKGTNAGITQAFTKLEEFEQSITCHKRIFTDSAHVKFLTSGSCSKDLEVLGKNVQCVLALSAEPTGLQIVDTPKEDSFPASIFTGYELRSNDRSSGSETAAAEVKISALQAVTSGSLGTWTMYQLSTGAKVILVQCDITCLPVDVIVNAANKSMNHGGGLARDIVEKGGDIIQDECKERMTSKELAEGDVLVTGAGRLACKSIFHAVGPEFKDGNKGEKESLSFTIMNCLLTASSYFYSSIAFPAISSGIFKYPVGEATQVVVETVKTYFESNPESNIREIYLCDISPQAVTMFRTALINNFPNLVPISSSASRTRAKENQTSVPVQTAKPSKTTQECWSKISIIEENIATLKTDVIVNSVSGDLDLSQGAISKSILSAAGQGLQQECRTKYSNHLVAGKIACTSGHNLHCKYVFHVLVKKWKELDEKQSITELKDLISKCLKKASKLSVSSIAFPPLGTGNWGYPPAVVADAMLEEINSFLKNKPMTTLKDIQICIFEDIQKSQIFKIYLKNNEPGQISTSRQNRTFSKQDISDDRDDIHLSEREFDINGLRLVIKQGDLTEEEVDAIVNRTNNKFELNQNAVSRALVKCGEPLQQACRAQVREMREKGISLTKAFNLKSKLIIHVDPGKFNEDWEAVFTALLKAAEKMGVYSLAFPLFDSSLPAQNWAKHLYNSLINFCNDSRQNLKEVRMVVYTRDLFRAFASKLHDLGEDYNKKSQGFWKMLRGVAKSTPVELERVKLYIYTADNNNVNAAVSALQQLVQEKVIHKVISVDDDLLNRMHTYEEKKILELGELHKVDIQINKFLGRIFIDGLITNVYTAAEQIHDVLRSACLRHSANEAAAILANTVQWCFLEITDSGTKKVEYEASVNHKIEKAFQDKLKTVDISDSEGRLYTFNFDSWTEYPKDDESDTLQIIRTDKIAGSIASDLPATWSKLNPGEVVSLVPLQAGREYQDVERKFQASLGNRQIKIIRVERVQNPTLYRQFQAKRAEMEQQNPGHQNEKTLYHGTSVDAIQNINQYGFNRSYCGKNATMYGQGVYFAVTSNYSSHLQYSPPAQGSNNRHIYQCRVLVGHSIKGSNQMRFLPQRTGHTLYDSATDNENRPTMYVIFNDTQAYPEYLITFQ